MSESSLRNGKIDWRLNVLRIALGILMLWFGILKFVGPSGISDDLAIRTMDVLSFGLLPERLSLYFIALLECAIGLGLLLTPLLRFTLVLVVLHLAGTALPLVFFPNDTWNGWFDPTFEGQYIIKNIIIGAAAIVLSAIPGHRKLETGKPVKNEH